MLKHYGVELILHGHDHVHSTVWIDGPSGPIPAIGVPSASALAHRRYPAAAYNLFLIEREGDNWRCEQTVRGYQPGAGLRELARAPGRKVALLGDILELGDHEQALHAGLLAYCEGIDLVHEGPELALEPITQLRAQIARLPA